MDGRGRPCRSAVVGTLDLRFLIGLVLYFGLSPITRAAFQDFGGAMGNSMLRFWAVEHILGMVIAVALAHVGRVRVRKTTDAVRRHKVAAIFFGLALVAILATIPWPGMPAGRPLFPRLLNSTPRPLLRGRAKAIESSRQHRGDLFGTLILDLPPFEHPYELAVP